MMQPGDRQLKANAFVRQVDEIAAREGCELPVPLLIAMVKLFGEALQWQLDASARAEARYEFTRCGAVDDAAFPRSRSVRRRGHAGRHFAASGARWGEEPNAAAEHAGVGEVIELLCFSGCGAPATNGSSASITGDR